MLLLSLLLFSATSDVSSPFRLTPPHHRNYPPIRTTSTALFAVGGPLQVEPIGIGSAVPSTILTNQDMEQIVDTSNEWIVTRTGISQRHVLNHQKNNNNHEETLRDLEVEAASQALQMAGIEGHDLDVVICATSTPDDLFGDAASVAYRLGCTPHTFAYDLTAACSGFLMGVVTASHFLNSGFHSYALVVGADALSRWADWKDRNTCVLGGDAAGAMVLRRSPDDDNNNNPSLLGYAIHSNGEGYTNLNCPYQDKGVLTELVPGVVVPAVGGYGKTKMNGKEVYKFATSKVPEVILEALEAAKLTSLNDVDWLVLHQANIRIIETVAEKLDIPMSKVITNIDRYGNTSAASIPLALTDALKSGKLKPGDTLVCSGFGAGLSWGAMVIKWQQGMGN